MNKPVFTSSGKKSVHSGLISSLLAATIMLAAAVHTSVAQNLGSIGQAAKTAAPYNTVYFGIYPQTFFYAVLEAMDHSPVSLYPAGPFVVVKSDNQVFNGGALSFGKSPRGQATIIHAEPLKWQIVKDDAEGFLLLTDGNIDVQAYNDQVDNPSWNGRWENASIRDWFTSHFLNGHSHDSIPSVYKASLTSYPATPISDVGKFNDLIGTVYPHSDLMTPPAGSTTAVWTATGAAARTDFFTQAEKDAIVHSLLTNPTFGANPDNVSTTDMIFLPAADVVETVYPVAATRRSVNTRYVMSYENTTSAPADDDWLTRTHSSAPFPGFVTQITRGTGAKNAEAATSKKPVRPALHLSRDRVLMVSQSKPGGTSSSFTATTFSPSNTLKLTLVDDAVSPFSASSAISPVDGYIPVSGNLALACSGGESAANSYISCLLEDSGGIRYYTKAATCTGSTAPVTLDFSGVTPGTYTLKVFNEIINTTGKPDYAGTPVLFDVYVSGVSLEVPRIAAGTLSNGFEGRTYSDTVKLSVAGSPAPKFALSAGSLPPGLALNVSTGRISGTLSAGSAGNHTFKVRVQNPAGSDERQFSIAVSAIVPPVIATTQADLAAVDSAQGYLAMPYSFRFKLQPGTGLPSVKFYMTSGNLPAGLTLEEDGTLHGTPVTVETQNFTICAETEGTYGYQSYTVSILTASPNPALPYFVTQDLGTSSQVKENTPFADTTIQVTGSQYINIHYDPSTFPTGITFDPSTRKILGTPVQGTAGTYNLHLWAKNPATKPASLSGPDSVGITYVLTVVIADVPAIITPSTLPAAAQGLFSRIDFVTDRPATLQWEGGLLPVGMTFAASPGSVSGIPSNPGTYTFKIKAGNAEGSSSKSFVLTVQPPSPPPVIDAFTLPDGTAGETYTGATVTAINNPSTWSWTGAPPGLSLSGSGIVSGTPTADGVYNVSFIASNAWGSSAIRTGRIIIRPSPLSVPPVFARFVPDGIEGTPYYAEVSVFNRPDIVWTLEKGTLPAGLTFRNGVISGTPAGPEGKYIITVKAASAGNMFAPATQELTVWIMSFTEEYRSRRVMLPAVDGMITVPESNVYYVKSGSDFTFVLTPVGSHVGIPKVTTGRRHMPDSIGVTVTPDSDGISYTVVIRDIYEEVNINVIPAANLPVAGAEKVWSAGGRLYISVTEATEVNVYNVTGNRVKTISAEAGQTTVAALSSGLYLVELNNKTVYKAFVK
ncbi:MAG: putative Ig domain-containing protein [Tannerella sp.]|jgi:hypothetical protein|nr:putative Ig domain-containing protein [Tannerella sp.]